MDKAQWSPINSEHPSAGNSPVIRIPNPSLTRLPINFTNGEPMRVKKQYTERPKDVLERPPSVNNVTFNRNLPAPEAESRSSKPRDSRLASGSAMTETGSSTPLMTISPDERMSERHVQGKRHEMGSNGGKTASIATSRAGSQTPRADNHSVASSITKRTEPQKPSSIQTAKQLYQAFNIQPPGNGSIVSEKQASSTNMSEPRQGSAKRTPGPRDTPASFTKDSPDQQTVELQETHTKPVQDRQPIEIDDQSSSSSEDDATHLPTVTGRKAEELIEEPESPLVDEPDHLTTTTSLPDDHPIEWLAIAKETYLTSLPPFVTKQKVGVRRLVEKPLAEGQRYAQKIEVVYRSWDAIYTFASIDSHGKRFIVKVFRGGATPYRPWLGPQVGFSETALAFSKQVPRGPKSSAATYGQRGPLPKGWALKEDDERDDDYSPANRRKSSTIRRRQRLTYNQNDEEEELDEDPFEEDSYQVEGQPRSERSSIEGRYAEHDPSGDPLTDSKTSTTQPPSKLINAVKKSLRLPKEQDVFPRPKQIKRRSIGGQAVTTDSGGNKRQKNKTGFSSDSENSVLHKRAKVSKAIPRGISSSHSANLVNVSQGSNYEPPTFDTHTLSPYKQAHTTLRIALVPYPLKSAIHRLRSCMTMDTFFSTVVGISGYKGDKDRIFGITATFDCKSDEDPDKSMVVREGWQDSFDVFLETVDGAESWTEEGGKCGVAVNLLLIDA